MRYANTDHYKLQAVTVTKDTPRLNDDYLWKVERVKTQRLVQLYRQAGYMEYAERAEVCATWLAWNWTPERKSLKSANFCRLRLCPMCIARGARTRAKILSDVMDAVQREHHCQYIFVTLTIRNVTADKLAETMTMLTDGWHRVMMQRPVARAIKGWYRALEVTRNNKKGDPWYGTYHPHIHAIWAVEDGYFRRRNGIYITKDDLIARWAKAYSADYDPSVKINRTYDRRRRRPQSDDEASYAATVEAAKYSTKDSDYISASIPDDEAVEVLKTYTKALYHRRLSAFGGWLKEEARRQRAVDMDNVDLTEGDGGKIRDDVADMIVYYGWHFGAGDYIYAGREVNPLKVTYKEDAKDDV